MPASRVTLDMSTAQPIQANPVKLDMSTAQPLEGEQPGWLDREIPLDSYGNATLSGVQSIGRGVRGALAGTWQALAHSDEASKALMQLPGQAIEIPGAIRDINASPDPTGTYAKAAQETAGQGAGQALLALGTEGVVKAAPAIAKGAGSVADTRVARAAGNMAKDAASDAVLKIPGVRQLANARKYYAATAPPAEAPPVAPAELPEAFQPAPKPYRSPVGTVDNPVKLDMSTAKPIEAAAPPAPTPAPAAAPTPKATPAALEQQLNDALGGKPALKPVSGVPMKGQAAAQAAAAGKLPEGFTPVKSSVLRGYKYDPSTQQFESITHTGQHYVTGEVTPEAVTNFEAADSPGAAWNELRSNATPIGKKINGQLVPYKRAGLRTADPNAPATEAAPAATPEPKPAAQSGGDDLLALLNKSLGDVTSRGVKTTISPADLAKRWGVDSESLAAGREQTRGMSPAETEQYVAKLAEAYKKGKTVEPVLETRDAENNIVSVDGRARAIAAERAGIKRIPIIVRKLPKATKVPTQ